MSSQSMKRREKLRPPDVDIERADRFEPDYAQECSACGQSPTVIVLRDGQVIADAGLCGPCSWGDARMIDPAHWND